jgi:hypothetical protein
MTNEERKAIQDQWEKDARDGGYFTGDHTAVVRRENSKVWDVQLQSLDDPRYNGTHVGELRPDPRGQLVFYRDADCNLSLVQAEDIADAMIVLSKKS